jgi:rhodanese-related sulfurtransferase
MAQHSDSDLVVNCKTSQRAKLAASILLKHGIHPIVLNENLENLKQKGFKMIEYRSPGVKDGGCCLIF